MSAQLSAQRVSVLAVTSVAAATLLLPPTAAAGGPVASGPPVALTGTVAGGAGVTALQAYVDQVGALDAGTARGPQPIRLPARTLSFADGRYTLAVDPAGLPARTVTASGLVTFRVVALDGRMRPLGETSATVRLLRATGTSAWVDPMLATDPASAATTARMVSGAPAAAGPTTEPAAGPTADAAGATADPTAPHAGAVADLMALRGVAPQPGTTGQPLDDETEWRTGAGVRTTRAGATKETSTSTAALATCGWPKGAGDVIVNRRSIWATIGTGYPVGRDRSFMSYSAGSAADYTATFGIGSSASGVWSQSGTRTVARSTGFAWSKEGYSRSYQVGVEYVKVAHYYDRCPPMQPYYYTWVPRRLDGAFGENPGIDRPDFTHCRQMGSSGTWWRQSSSGNAYSLSYGVKMFDVLGVDLSSRRQYNAEAKLGYVITKGRWLCGNDDLPSSAGKVMERTQNA